MTRSPQDLGKRQDLMAKLARLDITEDVRFDGRRMGEIVDELGAVSYTHLTLPTKA